MHPISNNFQQNRQVLALGFLTTLHPMGRSVQDKLFTHLSNPKSVKTTETGLFEDVFCQKMVLDWSANA